MPTVSGSLTAADIPPELSRERTSMAEAKEPKAPKTFAPEDVDPQTSTTLKARLKETTTLDGVTVDRMPRPQLSEAQKGALLAERETEQAEAQEAKLGGYSDSDK